LNPDRKVRQIPCCLQKATKDRKASAAGETSRALLRRGMSGAARILA